MTDRFIRMCREFMEVGDMSIDRDYCQATPERSMSVYLQLSDYQLRDHFCGRDIYGYTVRNVGLL